MYWLNFIPNAQGQTKCDIFLFIEKDDNLDPRQNQYLTMLHDEIVSLMEEKGIPLVEVPSKAELGKSVKLPVGCSSIAVLEFGGLDEEAKKILK